MTQTPQRGGRRSTRGRRSGPALGGAPARNTKAIRPLEPTLTPPDIASFQHWNLGAEIQGAIADMNITRPTPIQALAIGPVLEGRDVIAKAETGTGKTLAFGAPMMAKIDPQRASVLGLVLTPTRELAEQVMKVLAELGKPRGVKVALVVGGEPLEPQVRALQAGAQVVVGTPGRILDLYKQRFLSFPWTEFAILDEADVMLEIGFIDDVKQILSLTPDERQTMLFSATFPPELLKLAREYTRDPVEVATASGVKTVDNIDQSWIRVQEEDRALALIRLIETSADDDVFLVFCARRTDVDKLMRRLERLSFSIKALHGGYDQAARFRVMSAFRTGEVKVLVATDVASRGLDVKHVTTVVNYSSPQDITDYTHRIGRTGRAGRSGRAITLVGGIDGRKWNQIQREATWNIPEAELPQRAPRFARDRRGEERDAGRGPRRERAPERAPERDREPAPQQERAPRPERAPHGGRNSRRGGEDRGGDHRRRDERGRGDRERAAWPRDEHAPAASRREAQIEPRPDDPIDRRDRPLRHRSEPAHWPADDDAPRARPAGDAGRREGGFRGGEPRGSAPRDGGRPRQDPARDARAGGGRRADGPAQPPRTDGSSGTAPADGRTRRPRRRRRVD